MKIQISILFILFLFSSCCPEDDQLQMNQQFVIGTWKQIEPHCDMISGIYCDYIQFNDDQSFDVNEYTFKAYDFISLDSITITNDTESVTLFYQLEIENNTIEIRNYDTKIKGNGVGFNPPFIFEKVD